MNTASRKDLTELLPWYENGTLDVSENEAVRELLASDLEANRQLRELRALRAALVEEPIMATNMAMNLRRLHAQIDPQPMVQPRARRTWFVPLAMAATTLFAIATGFGLFMAGERAERYHVLTTPAELPPVPADNVLYRVDVAPGLDAAQLAALAGAPGVRVLQGPSEHGVALLAVPSADSEHVLARLRADPRLRFISPEPR